MMFGVDFTICNKGSTFTFVNELSLCHILNRWSISRHTNVMFQYQHSSIVQFHSDFSKCLLHGLLCVCQSYLCFFYVDLLCSLLFIINEALNILNDIQ